MIVSGNLSILATFHIHRVRLCLAPGEVPMGDQLPPETVREVDLVLERVWNDLAEERRASQQRLRRAQELMARTEELLAEMRAAESQQLEADLAEFLGTAGEAEPG